MRDGQRDHRDRQERRDPHEDMQVIRFARDVARNHNDQAGHHRMDAEIDKADEAAAHHLIQHGARTLSHAPTN